MRQLVYTMFISNNHFISSNPSFHLWWMENLVKHQKVSKYYETDCGFWLVKIANLLRANSGIWVESDHLSISRFLYILVSCMKEKDQNNFFWKILFHTEFIAYWSCAVTQPFVANCSQSEIWKEFFNEAQTCTFTYTACLKDNQKN